MASTMLGSLLVSLGLESGEFKSGLTAAETAMKKSAKNFDKIGKSISNVGRNLSIGVTAPLALFGKTAVTAATESREAFAQVESALKSMGPAAGRTAAQLTDMAKALQGASTFDDDDILKKVTANMLTFGNVTGTVFDQAQQAAVDLSARLGQDLQSSAIMLGKALNDPVKGLTALSRVGVSFTASQKDTIKSMAEAGDVAGAQALMLKELQKQYGGAAKAARDAAPGSDTIDAWRNFQETVGEIILKVLPTVTDLLTKVLNAFNNLSPGVQSAVVAIAAVGAAMGPVLFVFGNLVSISAPLIAAIKFIGVAAASTGTATGALTVALAGLRGGLMALITTLGPYALALAAVGAVLYLVYQRSNQAAQASAEYRDEQEKLEKVQDQVTGATQDLATATGQARKEALANAIAVRKETREYLLNAKAKLAAALATARTIQLENRAAILSASQSARGAGGGIDPVASQSRFNQQRTAQSTANLNAQNTVVKGLIAEVQKLDAIINAPAPILNVTTVDEKKERGAKDRAGPTGPSLAEIEARFNDELISYAQQTLGAMRQTAMSAAERAELDMRGVEIARNQTLKSIDADADYSKAQKDRLKAAVETLAFEERAAIEMQHQMEIEREIADLSRTAFENQREMLSLDLDMADTQAERKRIALQILALEQQERRQALTRIASSELLDKAIRARAQMELDALAAIELREQASAGRANESDLEKYIRDGNKSPAQMGEAITGIGLDGLDRLTDGISKALSEVKSLSDGFKAMRDIFKNVIQDMLAQLIRLQLQKALVGLLGGIGGNKAPTNLLAGIPGFANGVRNFGGGLAVVGERGPELVSMPRGSSVFSNSDSRSIMGGQSQTSVQIIPSPYFDVVVDGRVQSAAPGIAGAGAQLASASARHSQTRRLA